MIINIAHMSLLRVAGHYEKRRNGTVFFFLSCPYERKTSIAVMNEYIWQDVVPLFFSLSYSAWADGR
jgi:hypothetical protein